MTTHEQHHDPSPFETRATRALQELLAGRLPAEDDTGPLTGDVKACVDALANALQTDGVQAVRKAFIALAKDRPWLNRLASQQPAKDDDTSQEKPARRIRFLPTSAFLDRPPQEWLIRGVLPKDGIGMVYGLSGTYKSFLTMAWSLCIATGTPWLGFQVMRGQVAYIAAEGSYGIGKRVKAWMNHHNQTDVNSIAVRWFDETLILQNATHLEELLTALTEDFVEPPVLVVIDTLSRCSAGADENSNTEMAQLIACADLIRQRFHCTVLIVHHAGKDTQRGPRGASALFGNTETLIAVTPTAVGCMVSSVKPKDAPKFEDIRLATHMVRYGPLEDDSSLVLIHSNGDMDGEQIKRPESHATILACLQTKPLSYAELMQACVEAGQKKNTFKASFKALHIAGTVVKVGECWQINQGESPQQEPISVEQESETPE